MAPALAAVVVMLVVFIVFQVVQSLSEGQVTSTFADALKPVLPVLPKANRDANYVVQDTIFDPLDALLAEARAAVIRQLDEDDYYAGIGPKPKHLIDQETTEAQRAALAESEARNEKWVEDIRNLHEDEFVPLLRSGRLSTFERHALTQELQRRIDEHVAPASVARKTAQAERIDALTVKLLSEMGGDDPNTPVQIMAEISRLEDERREKDAEATQLNNRLTFMLEERYAAMLSVPNGYITIGGHPYDPDDHTILSGTLSTSSSSHLAMDSEYYRKMRNLRQDIHNKVKKRIGGSWA